MDNANTAIMSSSMNLLRRLPAKDVPKNLVAITNLIEDLDLRDDVQVKTDKPIEVGHDEQQGKDFLKCEYYKDGDSYRSPWSNQYYPAIVVDEGEEEPLYPPQDLLELEVKANEVFNRYCHAYYDDNYISSVYFFETDANGFGSSWLVKKSQKNINGIVDGAWDAIHLVTTNEDPNNKKAKYRLNSTVYVTLQIENEAQGKIDLAGHVSKVKEEFVQPDPHMDKDMQQFHIRNIGRMIEENEKDIRNEVQGIYITKSKQIIHTARLGSYEYQAAGNNAKNFGAELSQVLAAKKAQLE